MAPISSSVEPTLDLPPRRKPAVTFPLTEASVRRKDMTEKAFKRDYLRLTPHDKVPVADDGRQIRRMEFKPKMWAR